MAEQIAPKSDRNLVGSVTVDDLTSLDLWISFTIAIQKRFRQQMLPCQPNLRQIFIFLLFLFSFITKDDCLPIVSNDFLEKTVKVDYSPLSVLPLRNFSPLMCEQILTKSSSAMTIASITTRVCLNEINKLRRFGDFSPTSGNVPRPRAFPKYYYKKKLHNRAEWQMFMRRELKKYRKSIHNRRKERKIYKTKSLSS